jgi:hypothetical protein
MVQFTDEFGNRVWLVVQSILYFKDNAGGPFVREHQRAKSVVETTSGDLFYFKETCDEICEKLFGKKSD